MQSCGSKCAIFISFDAVSLSGITVEASKTAKELSRQGYRCFLDLGYDIKFDKGNFAKEYGYERDIYRDVFTLVRVDDVFDVPFYNRAFIEKTQNILISQKTVSSDKEKEALIACVNQSAQALSEKILNLWRTLDISAVLVENGTLPENIIYTKALYRAIEHYGHERGLHKYVIWRDHDLMWNSEKKVMKYGEPPYPYAVKPVASEFITYVTLNQDLKEKLESWCDHQVEVSVKKNTYDFTEDFSGTDLRRYFDIREQDIIIARTTRIIAQKRIDRDIILTQRLNRLFEQNDIDKKIFLIIAGDTEEDDHHYQHLQKLVKKLAILPQIKFIGPLHHSCISLRTERFTIEDLYYSSNLVSFLTSWDYDSYGNPIGEAISCQRCYIASRYEYYHEVYGQHGFHAPLMNISEDDDGLPDDDFINDVFALINDPAAMQRIAQANFALGKRVLSNNVIDILI